MEWILHHIEWHVCDGEGMWHHLRFHTWQYLSPFHRIRRRYVLPLAECSVIAFKPIAPSPEAARFATHMGVVVSYLHLRGSLLHKGSNCRQIGVLLFQEGPQ